MSTAENNTIVTDSKPLIIKRTFDAPVETMWRSFSEPDLAQNRWGPIGFTTPSAEIDFREGGKYVFCMRGADGKNIYSTGVYREIVPSGNVYIRRSRWQD